MKKLLLTLVLLGICLLVGLGTAMAARTPAGITGSLHDFSAESFTHGNICSGCHIMHHAQLISEAPLWDHELSTMVYQVYSSPTLNATVGQPEGISKLCLSCHDGTIAVEGTGGTMFVTGGAVINDLRTTHPISFTYDTALATADGGLHDPASKTTVLGGTIATDLLTNGKMHCTSCHDAHNNLGNYAMLKMSSGGADGLCLTCHDK